MKIMAIDYGDAHTGIAISDATGTLAGFTTVIDSRKAEVVVQEILRRHRRPPCREGRCLRRDAAAGGRPPRDSVGRAAHHGGCPQHPI